MNKTTIELIFDDECLMCNSFIASLDKFINNDIYLIRAYGSFKLFKTYNQELAKKYVYLDKVSQSSIIAISESNCYIYSSAIIFLLSKSKSKLIIMLSLMIRRIPKCIRDNVYKIIANNRKRLGMRINTKQSCVLKYENIMVQEQCKIYW